LDKLKFMDRMNYFEFQEKKVAAAREPLLQKKVIYISIIWAIGDILRPPASPKFQNAEYRGGVRSISDDTGTNIGYQTQAHIAQKQSRYRMTTAPSRLPQIQTSDLGEE
jgi:hypothetical protein